MGGGQEKNDRFVHKRLKVDEYLVKAKSRLSPRSQRCARSAAPVGIKGDVYSSTRNRSPEPHFFMSATAVPSVRKPVECGVADIALYVRRLAPLTLRKRPRQGE